MAELATLARPYARAAFDAAREVGDDGLDRWSRMLAILAAVLEEDAVAEAVVSPERTPEGKAGMIIEVLGDDLDEQGRNLVRLLAENRRLELAPEIAPLFEELKDEYQRTLEVEIVSAREISKKDLKTLSDKLAARFDKKIELSSRIDPALLGGAVIRAGDEVIDGSIRGRLDRLADTLRARV